jgi:hypothetical protein
VLARNGGRISHTLVDELAASRQQKHPTTTCWIDHRSSRRTNG